MRRRTPTGGGRGHGGRAAAAAAAAMLATVALTAGCTGADGTDDPLTTATVTATASSDPVTGTSAPATPSASPESSPPPSSPSSPSSPSPTGTAAAGDHLQGTPGLDVGASLVAGQYGEGGPEIAVVPNAGTDGTAASGCTPGGADGDALPDGIWAGQLTSLSGGAAGFDLVCYSTVDSLDAAGLDDAIEDYEISNDRPDVRQQPYSGTRLQVFLQSEPTPVPVGTDLVPIAYAGADLARVQAYIEAEEAPFGFLLVEGGEAVEFYAPPLAFA